MSFKAKKILKNISLALLGVGTIGAVGYGGTKLVQHITNDTKTLSLSYDVGSLGTDGKYVNDESKIYTKEKFACDGLKATLDFDSEIKYQIFFYDSVDNFISKSDEYESGYVADIPWNAAFSRIMITPTNDEDEKVSFMEKYKYGNQLHISVNKNAESNVKSLFRNIGSNTFRSVSNVSDSIFEYGANWDNENNVITHNNQYSCTTHTILSVSGHEYVKLDKTIFNDSSNSSLRLFQYSLDNDNNLNFISTIYLDSSNSYSSRLSKDCNYVIMSYWSQSSDLQNFTSNIQNGLIISKTSIN